MSPRWQVHTGDALAVLRTLPDGSAQTCVTSPPYYGLRDYGHADQLGLEPTLADYVSRLVAVFAEVRRVLRDDGTLWLNLGDSYASTAQGTVNAPQVKSGSGADAHAIRRPVYLDLKPKDLVGVPWAVAFALRADGWYLRSDIVWAKPNPMPESVTDRPTRAHEYVFLLSKGARYWYDADAIREEDSGVPAGNGFAGRQQHRISGGLGGGDGTPEAWQPGGGRNARSVWTIATQPSSVAHFAVMPRTLAERCILAGASEGATVLDPFCGAGTTGLVALRHGRSFVGIELNPDYAQLARHRITDDAPLLNAASEAA